MADTNDTFRLSGSIAIRPSPYVDGDASCTGLRIYEEFESAGKQDTVYTLNADGAQAVSLGGLSGASSVTIDPDQPVVVTLTSAAGVAQTISVDGFTTITSKSAPYTAISLTRPLGVATKVRVVLAQST